MTSEKLFPDICRVRLYKKNKAKIFSSFEILHFFWTICVFNKFLGLKKHSYKFHSFCQIIVLTLINCSLIFGLLNITRKTGQLVSFHWKDCLFFSKNCDFNNLLGPRNCSYKKYSNGRNSLWTLVGCSLRLVTLDNTRKMGPKCFVIVKTAFFWDVCFYRPLISQKSGLIICTIDVKIPCRPF